MYVIIICEIFVCKKKCNRFVILDFERDFQLLCSLGCISREEGPSALSGV